MSDAMISASVRAIRPTAATISAASTDIQATPDNVLPFDLVARLVERAKDGDKGAYGQIFRLHRDAVLRFARLHVGGDADDVVSEVFVRAWVGLHRYENRGAPFVAWLYGIVRHVVADELSRRSRTRPKADISEPVSTCVEDDRLTIAEAIERLPMEQRLVIEMKFLMGMRNPEVADVLNTTTSTVNTRQWRALAALRDRLQEER